MSKRSRKALLCLGALGMTALLAAALPMLHTKNTGTPPGVRTARRRLITVWYAGELPGAADWLRERAAAYGRQNPGARVWLRTVSAAALAAELDTPPDLLAFSAEVEAPPGPAMPLCRSGYALLIPDGEAATARPGSLLGVSPTPDPAATPRPAEADWPEPFWAPEGFGALALQEMGAPAGARFAPEAEVLRRFLAGEPALLSIAQARAAQARGVGFRLAAACPATDLALYGMALGPEGEALLDFLTAEPAQRALSARGLLPVLPGLRLYGPDRPMLQALEIALDGGWQAPAFLWPRQCRAAVLAAEAMYRGWGDGDGVDSY